MLAERLYFDHIFLRLHKYNFKSDLTEVLISLLIYQLVFEYNQKIVNLNKYVKINTGKFLNFKKPKFYHRK